MSQLTDHLISYVLLYKYWAIFFITYISSIALPLPAGTVNMAAAAFASQGYLNLPILIFVGILGNIFGDSSGYWLVRVYGPRVFKYLGLSRLLDPKNSHLVHKSLERHPVMTIYFSRFFTGIAPAVNGVAGLFKFSYSKFLFFEVLGEITEVTFFALCGYALGSNWQAVSGLVSKGWFLIVLGALATFIFWRVIFKKSRV